MVLSAVPLDDGLIPFVHRVYEQNRGVLHGNAITLDGWREAFGEEADPYEVNFIIMADGAPAAWLKINGLNRDDVSISMLVVDNAFRRRGVGSFAVNFAEDYARNNGKTAIRIYTTKDNEAAKQCYLKQGYEITKEIIYAVGDGVGREGYEFGKRL